ncbi:MAG: hypothetical protein GTO63_27055 [Anaerolineae bacterium]|nr:hypothetical protein [Anaerolineae bacterium]NIN98391.1 hypothetical protein [Anaerolineae bacterium]NIQ81306.1 hypothetical protein [Anaerolineae bacterium]
MRAFFPAPHRRPRPPPRPGARLLGAISALLVVACFASACETEQHFFDVTGDLFVVSAADYYPQAVEKASDWRPDAYLAGISARPAPSASIGLGPSLRYYFESASAESEFYKVSLRHGTWSAETVPKGASSVTYPPINREDWTLDSVDAWAIAQANGGEEFLLNHQDPLTMMALSLSHERVGDREDVLVWRVWYRVGSATVYDALDMMIDPKTGDILQLETD